MNRLPRQILSWCVGPSDAYLCGSKKSPSRYRLSPLSKRYARRSANAGEVWQVDDLFFDLIRDRPTINAMLAEVAGKSVAKSNADEKVKTQKKVIQDCLAGENWRSKVEGWLPGWMQFPFKPYGKGASSIADAAKAAAKTLHI